MLRLLPIFAAASGLFVSAAALAGTSENAPVFPNQLLSVTVGGDRR